MTGDCDASNENSKALESKKGEGIKEPAPKGSGASLHPGRQLCRAEVPLHLRDPTALALLPFADHAVGSWAGISRNEVYVTCPRGRGRGTLP